MLKAYQRSFWRFMVRNSVRERRRLWVVMMYAGLAGWTVMSLLIGLPGLRNAVPSWAFYTAFISSASVGALGFLVTASTSTYVSHGLKASTEPQSRELDERQRSVWDRAIRKAYFVIFGVLLVNTFYWAFVQPISDVLDEGTISLLSITVFLLALSLPNAIVAWTEPDAEE